MLAWLLTITKSEGPEKQANILRRFAVVSKHQRFGFPVTQLAHALVMAGERELCCEVVRNCLLPAVARFSHMSATTVHVACLKELIAMIEKRGMMIHWQQGEVTYPQPLHTCHAALCEW